MDSETQSLTPSTTNKSSWVAWVFLVVSFIGFLDSSYLTAEHFLNIPVPCGLFGGNCNIVLSSSYSEVLGIPVALLGALYYLAFFLGTVLFLQNRSVKLVKLLSLYSVFGLLASIWLVILQFFIIDAICQYCMLSATTSTLLFIFSMVHLAKSKKTAV